ncbi:hypothetical protein KM043_013098 [Ampulex compressa]|nr:hypothetical protein KM043_013098 [Ampulex compressa]
MGRARDEEGEEGKQRRVVVSKEESSSRSSYHHYGAHADSQGRSISPPIVFSPVSARYQNPPFPSASPKSLHRGRALGRRSGNSRKHENDNMERRNDFWLLLEANVT